MPSTYSLFVAILLWAFLVGASKPTFVEPHYVHVPGGRQVWSECVHGVPSGSHIELARNGIHVVRFLNGSMKAIPPCSKPTIITPRTRSEGAIAPGWQIWGQIVDSNQIVKFLGNFTVPKAPTAGNFNTGNTIVYLFTGLEGTAEEADIIQPVLQYGKTPAGGGAYWGLASWYVTSGGVAVFSQVINASTGDTIFGNMTQVGQTAWFINGVVDDSAGTNITVNKPGTLKSIPNAYCTLEAYGIQQCSWFPPSGSSCAFSDMLIEDSKGQVTTAWQPTSGPGCGLQITTSDTSTLSINF